jgi:hypothetical protein
MTDTDTMRWNIEIVAGVGGPKAMIAGHRVRVEDVVVWHEWFRPSDRSIVTAGQLGSGPAAFSAPRRRSGSVGPYSEPLPVSSRLPARERGSR